MIVMTPSSSIARCDRRYPQRFLKAATTDERPVACSSAARRLPMTSRSGSERTMSSRRRRNSASVSTRTPDLTSPPYTSTASSSIVYLGSRMGWNCGRNSTCIMTCATVSRSSPSSAGVGPAAPHSKTLVETVGTIQSELLGRMMDTVTIQPTTGAHTRERARGPPALDRREHAGLHARVHRPAEQDLHHGLQHRVVAQTEQSRGRLGLLRGVALGPRAVLRCLLLLSQHDTRPVSHSQRPHCAIYAVPRCGRGAPCTDRAAAAWARGPCARRSRGTAARSSARPAPGRARARLAERRRRAARPA